MTWDITSRGRMEIDVIPFNVNPYSAKLIYLNFHSLEVVSRYRDPQLQVAKKLLICV